MFNQLIFILPVVTLILFCFNIFYKGNTVQSSLLFILTLLPLMDLKIVKEAYGGFRTFDAICVYSIIFLFKDFTTINLKNKNNFYFFLFILFSIINLLGGLYSEFPNRAYLNLVRIFPIFIFGRFFLTECYKYPTFHYKAIKALKISYITALSFLFLQVIFGLQFTFYPGLSPNTIDPIFKVLRFPGVFYDSQVSGQFLAMGSFLFLFNPDGQEKKTVMLNHLIFIFMIVGLILAGSRAALGGFILSLIVVFIMAGKKYRIYGIIFIVSGFLIYSVFSLNAGVFERTQNF